MTHVAQLIELEKEHGELLRQVEAAAFLGITDVRMQQLGKAGILHFYRVGGATLYPRKQLEAWKQRRDSKSYKIGRGHKAEPVTIF